MIVRATVRDEDGSTREIVSEDGPDYRALLQGLEATVQPPSKVIVIRVA